MSNLIYLHRNLINNKVYIGKTKNIDNPNIRWANGKGYSHQPFYEDIIKYGWENFEHIILETDIPDELIVEKENYWINFYEAMNPEKGYNQCLVGGTISEETKKRMSQSWKKDQARIKRQRESMINMNKTIGRTGSNNSMYGRSRKGKDAGQKRRVQCIETGEIFETLTDASKWCNPNGSNLKSHIAQQIRGERKYCGRHPETNIPLHWKYIDN